MIQIRIQDQATPDLQALHDRLKPANRRRLMVAAGSALTRQLKEHFTQRNFDTDTKRARKGWPKQNFWTRRVAQKTRLGVVTASTATIQIASPEFAAKLKGANIRPGPGKRALAIPLRAIVYGKRAAAQPVPGLFVFRSPRSKKAFLASTEGPDRPGRLTVYYRLLRSVRVPADPKALPSDKSMQETVNNVARRFILPGA